MTTLARSGDPALPPAKRAGGSDRPAWAAFLCQELLGPIDALAGLSEVLAREAASVRPDDYLADLGKLRHGAARLLGLARGLLELAPPAAPDGLPEAVRRARHDVGNGLNQVSGLVQLLQIQEEALMGAFLPDLERILDLCRHCEARLLQQGSGPAQGGPCGAGLAQAEIARVVEQIRPADAVEPTLTGSVLIADDDPVNREVLRRLLEQEGHRVAEARDGGEALRLLAAGDFDVLLLDILMPEVSGFEVLRQLREREALRRTAVVVISALDEVQSLVHCLGAGAQDYLTKPVDRLLLRARINACLRQRQQRARELEQFFPPEVVRGLLDRPEALQAGRSAEVTVLFCDIRGFSRVSERLRGTPHRMVAWVRAVMEALDECVLRHEGVLIDFIGDELMTMWGAPGEQPDHARRACRAALDMLACVSRLSDEWKGVIGEETVVGIGINSGPVSVGNTGTRRRFKYGAVGNTVNLASRVQGATKYLRARAVMTESTLAQLGGEFTHRRLSRLRVVNIDEPVNVYELAPPGEPGWEQCKQGYEKALALFEAGPEHLQEAAVVLGSLVTPFGVQGPNLFLLSRVLGAMQDRGAWSDVYVLPGK